MHERIEKTAYTLSRSQREEAGGTVRFTDHRESSPAQARLQQTMVQGVAQRTTDPLRNAMQTSPRSYAAFAPGKNPTGIPDKKTDRPVLQAKFYNGKHEYANADEMKIDLKDLLARIKKSEFPSDQLDFLANTLWAEYGESTEKHIEMGVVTKYARRSKMKRAYEILKAIKKHNPGTANPNENFAERIGGDARLLRGLRNEYIAAWSNKREYPDTYERIKKAVKEARNAGANTHAQTVGYYLLEGNYAVRQDLEMIEKGLNEDDLDKLQFIYLGGEVDEEIREIVKPKAHARHNQLNNLKLSEQASDFNGKDVDNVNALCKKLETRVLRMKDDLYGAFYYNNASNEIIVNSGELSSFRSRPQPQPQQDVVTGNDEHVLKNTTDMDVAEHTDDYVFMFIEHKDTPVNVRTRFAKDKDGLMEGAMRRRRRLNKLARIEGVTLQLDDLAKDTVGKKIIGEEKRDQEKRLFRHGGDKDRLVGILKNLVAGVKHRLSLIDDIRKYKDVIDSLDVLVKEGTDLQLWSYLVRYIIQPQFMVPKSISHAMKGQSVDGPMSYKNIKALDIRDKREKAALKEMGVKYFKQSY